MPNIKHIGTVLATLENSELNDCHQKCQHMEDCTFASRNKLENSCELLSNIQATSSDSIFDSIPNLCLPCAEENKGMDGVVLIRYEKIKTAEHCQVRISYTCTR